MSKMDIRIPPPGYVTPEVDDLAQTLAAERGHAWAGLTSGERALYRRDAYWRLNPQGRPVTTPTRTDHRHNQEAKDEAANPDRARP